ncbi:MAG TPA: hypothetical protein VH325_00810 [Bryobacteraceae bacterium]|jgi:hypothetical protein|nr:hypothetical protein [Bryobacteraceae bacterium]
MGQRLRSIAAVILFCAVLPLYARSKKISEIEQTCQDIVAEFPNGPSRIFAGPDPWFEVDTPPPNALRNGSWAYVYAEGPSIRWLFVREVGPENAWLQDINYFYRQDGTLAKRQRSLSAFKSNVSIEAIEYYDANGNLIKDITHHHPLSGRHEDTSSFIDHEPPLFPTVADVPFSDDLELGSRLI